MTSNRSGFVSTLPPLPRIDAESLAALSNSDVAQALRATTGSRANVATDARDLVRLAVALWEDVSPLKALSISCLDQTGLLPFEVDEGEDDELKVVDNVAAVPVGGHKSSEHEIGTTEDGSAAKLHKRTCVGVSVMQVGGRTYLALGRCIMNVIDVKLQAGLFMEVCFGEPKVSFLADYLIRIGAQGTECWTVTLARGRSGQATEWDGHALDPQGQANSFDRSDPLDIPYWPLVVEAAAAWYTIGRGVARGAGELLQLVSGSREASLGIRVDEPATVLIERYEAAMREFVRKRLVDTFGEAWEDHLPKTTRKRAQRRRSQEKASKIPVKEEGLLDYLDVRDYQAIVEEAYDQAFASVLPRRLQILAALEEIADLRNPAMHSRGLARRGRERLHAQVEHVLRLIRSEAG